LTAAQVSALYFTDRQLEQLYMGYEGAACIISSSPFKFLDNYLHGIANEYSC